MFTLVFGTILILILFLDHYSKRRRNEAFNKFKLKGPTALPIIGCGLQLIKLGPKEIIPYFGELFERYGETFRLWMLHEAQIYTTDIRIIEAILTSNTELKKSDLYDLLRTWIYDGLLLSTGKKWRARRKAFTPAFHFRMLDQFVGIFNDQAEIMIKKLKSEANGKEFDIMEYVGLAAMDAISETALGVKVNAQLDPSCLYVKALKRVTYIQSDRLFKINQRYDIPFKLTAPKLYQELQENMKIMYDYIHNVIKDRRSILERSIADGSYKPLDFDNDGVGMKQQLAFLDILLQANVEGSPLTNHEIYEEVATFTFEGHDTTTSALAHGFYSLSRHADVQQKLYSEIVSNVGKDKNANISMNQVQSLQYLDCVVKEILRLYPSVPAVGRRTEKDVKIDDIIIPSNTNVYLVPYFAHRNPKYFEDPESFRPERFLEIPENTTEKTTFAYIPFSAGPRNCIGQRFALLEMKTLITKMLLNYELLPAGPPVEPLMTFILGSSMGTKLALRPR